MKRRNKYDVLKSPTADGFMFLTVKVHVPQATGEQYKLVTGSTTMRQEGLAVCKHPVSNSHCVVHISSGKVLYEGNGAAKAQAALTILLNTNINWKLGTWAMVRVPEQWSLLGINRILSTLPGGGATIGGA